MTSWSCLLWLTILLTITDWLHIIKDWKKFSFFITTSNLCKICLVHLHLFPREIQHQPSFCQRFSLVVHNDPNALQVHRTTHKVMSRVYWIPWSSCIKDTSNLQHPSWAPIKEWLLNACRKKIFSDTPHNLLLYL